MTRNQYLQLFKKLTNKMFDVTRRKNADYTKGVAEDDPFANFRQVEKMGICSAEVGILTRMSDKFARVMSWVKNGKLEVADEGVEDTLLDLAIYSLLLLGYIISKKAATAVKKKKRPSRRVVVNNTKLSAQASGEFQRALNKKKPNTEAPAVTQ